MARLLETHLRHRKLRNIKESPEVCFRGFAKVFGRVFCKGLGYEDSRIVYQQVDSSEIADSRIHHLLRYIGACDIAVNELQTISGRQSFGRCDISRVCNHAVPGLKKPFCDPAANAS